MTRLNKRDALTNAMGVTDIPVLHLYDHHPGMVDKYEISVVSKALQSLGFEKRQARDTARSSAGCARVRLNDSLKRLRYHE